MYKIIRRGGKPQRINLELLRQEFINHLTKFNREIADLFNCSESYIQAKR